MFCRKYAYRKFDTDWFAVKDYNFSAKPNILEPICNSIIGDYNYAKFNEISLFRKQ